MTQAISAIAESDPPFAKAFVALVLKVARKDARHRAKVRALGRVPTKLTCRAEESVYDEFDFGLGRVDLRFDGGTDFTLLVENKLHSGFGKQQLQRYRDALAALPEDRKRSGLIAITRDVPSYGELDAGEPGWLGSIRWARLYDEGLASLPIVDADVAKQWKLFIDILHDQGDLGLTTVQQDLILAWSRYAEGQRHLADILHDVRQRGLDILRDELTRRHRGHGPRESLSNFHYFGQREAVVVSKDKHSVWTGYRVPARVNRASVRLTFFAQENKPVFMVDVAPWKGSERLEADERQLVTAARKLAKAGFESTEYKREQVWWAEHPAKDFLKARDVPERLVELMKRDISTIVQSGILKYDLHVGGRGRRGGPPRVRANR